MNKLQKALKVYNDLKTLTFVGEDHGSSTVYTLTHPNGNYSLWTANGFWFIGFYYIDGERVDYDDVGKFGALGKIIVWWEASKIVRKLKKQRVCSVLSKI